MSLPPSISPQPSSSRAPFIPYTFAIPSTSLIALYIHPSPSTANELALVPPPSSAAFLLSHHPLHNPLELYPTPPFACHSSSPCYTLVVTLSRYLFHLQRRTLFDGVSLSNSVCYHLPSSSSPLTAAISPGQGLCDICKHERERERVAGICARLRVKSLMREKITGLRCCGIETRVETSSEFSRSKSVEILSISV